MNYKTYFEYKNSNNIWAGKVPIHWELHKIKNLIFFQEGPGLRNWQFTDNGIRVICVTNITSNGIDFSNYEKFISEEEYRQTYSHFTVNQGDLLLSSSGNSWGKVAEYTDDETVILNTSTIRINKNPASDYELKQPYIKWALQSEYIREQLGLMMTGSCQPNFGPTHLAKVSILMPPIKEQEQIANYLDKKTAKIDKTIAKNKELIQLLNEKRVALINQVVTKGLNQNVSMKNSGVTWIGKIPEHWKVVVIKELFENRSEKVSDKIYPPLSVTKKGVVPQLDNAAKTDNNDSRKKVLVGDFVINSRSDRKGSCGVSNYDGSVSLIYHVLKPKQKFMANYYHYLFRSKMFAEEFYRWGHGIVDDLWSTRYDEMKKILVPVPPKDEMNDIIEYLNSELDYNKTMIDKIEYHNKLLNEYKTSLIYHVVTGKIDVRGEEI